jgi:hypothetical protein
MRESAKLLDRSIQDLNSSMRTMPLCICNVAQLDVYIQNCFWIVRRIIVREEKVLNAKE